MTTTTVPQAVILFVRQSDARHDEERGGIDYHIKLLHAEAARRGWGVLKVVVENDVPDGNGGVRRKQSASASKLSTVTLPDGFEVERVVRPRFAECITDMRVGRADGMLAHALDRYVRDHRTSEDLIETVRARKLNVGSLTGTLELTDGGTQNQLDQARFLVTLAAREVAIKRERTLWARERDMCKAMGHGGYRPYGWADDYKTAIPEEKLVVEAAAMRIMHGISQRALAAELNGAEVPTVSGKPWSAESIRSILMRPRNGGLVLHQGEIVDGLVGEWERLISPELCIAVRDELKRRASEVPSHGGGRTLRWQGSGLYLCGECNDGTTVSAIIGGRSPRYRCRKFTHLSRNVAGTDAVVDDWIIDRLSQPDALWMFNPVKPSLDVPALRAERAAMTANMATMAVDVAMGRVKRADHLAARTAVDKRTTEIDRVLAESVRGGSLVADLVSAEDIRATWESYPVATRQAIINDLAVVTIKPYVRVLNKFDPTSIDIQPRVWAEMELAA